jgi:hypothetical protein
MSPSEFDLRAALHHGEGDDLNVDQLVLGARARAAQRRVRLLSTAAVVAVVAGASVGIAQLAGNNGEQAGSNAAGAGSAATNPNADSAYGARSQAKSAPQRALAPLSGVACPTTPPHYLLPGGGSPGQFGSGGPLFSKPVSSVVVCAYGSALQKATEPRSHPVRLELQDGAATRLAASLENASKTPVMASCPGASTEQEFAIIGVATDGTRLPAVTASLADSACVSKVTNGTAIRYQWSPPQDLRERLLALTPSGQPKSTMASPTG